tara:strand:- start:124 stop:663 length:540 start_codon:yes stop_codon:yes gene_type:complete
MKKISTSIEGCYLIKSDAHVDHRGTFSRKFCMREFGHDTEFSWVQENVSTNLKKGTLRGMHMQAAPYGEIKLVSCTKGVIYDVVIDLRENSSTFGKWEGFELSEGEIKSVFVPIGCGHGYLTLTDETEVRYLVSEYYVPESEVGIMWDDPSIGVVWPIDVEIVSDKDQANQSFMDYKSR